MTLTFVPKKNCFKWSECNLPAEGVPMELLEERLPTERGEVAELFPTRDLFEDLCDIGAHESRRGIV